MSEFMTRHEQYFEAANDGKSTVAASQKMKNVRYRRSKSSEQVPKKGETDEMKRAKSATLTGSDDSGLPNTERDPLEFSKWGKPAKEEKEQAEADEVSVEDDVESSKSETIYSLTGEMTPTTQSITRTNETKSVKSETFSSRPASVARRQSGFFFFNRDKGAISHRSNLSDDIRKKGKRQRRKKQRVRVRRSLKLDLGRLADLEIESDAAAKASEWTEPATKRWNRQITQILTAVPIAEAGDEKKEWRVDARSKRRRLSFSKRLSPHCQPSDADEFALPVDDVKLFKTWIYGEQWANFLNV